MNKYNFPSYNEAIKYKKNRKQNFEQNKNILVDNNQRNWLKNKKKEEYIDFDDDYIKKIKQYFNSLVSEGNDSIGIDEIKEPLLSLGIAKDLEEVRAILSSIDDDESGRIEFSEFLMIIKGKSFFYKKPENGGSNVEFVDSFKSNIKRNN